MLQLSHISVEIQKKEILKDITFSAYPGEIIGLVAPNGSGKTTLLRTITNLITPVKGKVSIYDMNYENHREDILNKLFFLQDNTILYRNLTGKEHLKLIKKIWKSSESITKIIGKLNMEDYIDKKVFKYSLGMQQRLLFAMCLVSSCDLLLMDEPMNGLDPSNIRIVSNYIKELKAQNKIIFFSSHILNNIDDLCDRVIFLRNGEIVHETNHSSVQTKKYISIRVDNEEDVQLVPSFLAKDEIREINQGKIELEIGVDKVPFFLNQLLEHHINFKSLKVDEKNSQQIYADLYERKEH